MLLEKKQNSNHWTMWPLVIFRSWHSLNGFESALDKELFRGVIFSVRGSWARGWGPGALCSPRTELTRTFLLPLNIYVHQWLTSNSFPGFHSLPSPSAEPWAGSLPGHSDSAHRNCRNLIHPGLIHPSQAASGQWAAVDGQPRGLQGTDFSLS